jgi:hypothetical protein
MRGQRIGGDPSLDLDELFSSGESHFELRLKPPCSDDIQHRTAPSRSSAKFALDVQQ